MFGFLNATMSGATSRFITYEMGKGDPERLSKTFSSAMIVHIIIAFVIVLISETFGMWWLMNKLVIPEGRMNSAIWVFQFSIISSVVGITQVPYSAAIISHEAMSVYAYMSIIEAVLKLGIVYLLLVIPIDHLILYAALILLVSVSIRVYYRIYCHKRFPETHFHFTWDKAILLPMLTFSGWDFYGNMCVSVRRQGVNFLVNIFFGIIYNAASSIATTVSGVVLGLSSNVLTAFRPQIIKYYAAGNVSHSMQLLYSACKYSGILILLMVVPLSLEIDIILSLWLVIVPTFAVQFCKFTVISVSFSVINNVLVTGIHATGNVRRISFISGSLYLISLVITWIGYKCGFSVLFAYYVAICLGCSLVVVNMLIINKQVSEFSVSSFLRRSILPLIFFTIFDYCLTRLLIICFSSSSFVDTFFIIIFSVIGSLVFVTLLLLNRNEKLMLTSLIYKKNPRLAIVLTKLCKL